MCNNCLKFRGSSSVKRYNIEIMFFCICWLKYLDTSVSYLAHNFKQIDVLQIIF